jgi:hypothetical protein
MIPFFLSHLPKNVYEGGLDHHLMTPIRRPPLVRHWSVFALFAGYHHCTVDAGDDQYLRLRPGHHHHWHGLLPKVRLVRYFFHHRPRVPLAILNQSLRFLQSLVALT